MTYWSNGSPTLDFALHTMRLFARGGVRFLNNESIKKTFLGTTIIQRHESLFVSDPDEVEESLKLERVKRKGNFFLPLPAMHKGMRSGNTIAFFRPRLFQKIGFPDELRIELILIWPSSDQSAAFRFERGFRDNDLHGYSHFQLSHSVSGGFAGFVGTSLPCGLTLYSPATPLPAVQFSTWFSMLLSLSGQSYQRNSGLLQVFAELEEFGSTESYRKASKTLAHIVKDLLNGEQFVPGIICSMARRLRLP